MYAIRSPLFRTRYVAVAVCVMVGAWCVSEAQGLMQAVITVGTDAQLPLERIATDSSANAQVSGVSQPSRLVPAASSPPAQPAVRSWQKSSHRADGDSRSTHRTFGYRREITGSKYWT
jgi:hypothetical protein